MDSLVIPSSVNWYEPDVMACAPDNTLIYGSRQDIVIIRPATTSANNVQIITRAHSTKVITVNINKNWGDPVKYAVTLSDDGIIKLWNMETLEKKLSHRKHSTVVGDDSKVVGVEFAGNNRVVSVSEKGTIIIWNILNEEFVTLSQLFGKGKVSITCLSVCPHLPWVVAFGMRSGLIVVVDIRRTGKVLFNLRGHSAQVRSLSWCPAPINVFPTKPQNKVVEKKPEIVPKEGDAVYRRKQKDPRRLVFPATVDLLKGYEELRERQFLMISRLLDSHKDTRQQTSSRRRKFDIASLFKTKTGCEPGEPISSPKKLETDAKCSSSQDSSNTSPTDTRVLPMDISYSTQKIKTKIVTNPNQILTDQGPRLVHANAKHLSTNCDAKMEPTITANVNESAAVDVKCISGEVSPILKQNVIESTPCEDVKVVRSVGSGDGNEPKSTSLNESKSTESVSDSSEVFQDAHNESFQKTDDPEVEQLENWRTEQPVIEEEQPRQEFLLASSANEPNIYIWRAGTDGRLQTFIKVPSSHAPKGQKKAGRNKAGAEKCRIVVCWVTPNSLLSSSQSAELLQWTLPKPLGQSKFPLVVHRQHWSVLFSIKAPIQYSDQYNFLHKMASNVWTSGMDRWITDIDFTTKKLRTNYPALGGSVNCIAASPFDPSRVACGLGENMINVLNMGQSTGRVISCQILYHYISGAVTALAWHPVLENSLAWGTVEGRMGVFELWHKGRKCKLLPHCFNSQIFKMEWGPHDSAAQKTELFVVAEGQVAIFNPEANNSEPTFLTLPHDTLVYTIAWKPSYGILLVSTKSGALLVYSSNLSLMRVSYLSEKLQSIVWHPHAAFDDVNTWPCCNIFASVVKNTKFYVFDLTIQSENLEDSIVARFENRNVKITGMAWSPYEGKFLAFVDEEGVGQVYDIESKTIISTFINTALDSLLCVHWSPVNSDCIVVGATSHKIIVWKTSEHLPLTKIDITLQRNKIMKLQQNEVSDLVVKSAKVLPPVDDVEQPLFQDPRPKPQQNKSRVVPIFYSLRDETQARDIQRLLQWVKTKEDAQPIEPGDKQFDILEIFGGNSGFMKTVFEVNMTALRLQGAHDKANLLSLFQGDVGSSVKFAIETKRVDPWIISMCPMVSPHLWQKACQTYVEQLLEQPKADPLEIVTYLLATHRVTEAVDVLCDRQMFREAFVLAKARYGPGGLVAHEVLDKWGKNCEFQGNYEMAACCFITLQNYEKAARMLFRRADPDLQEISAELAEMCGKEDLRQAAIRRMHILRGDSVPEKEPPEDNKNTGQHVANSKEDKESDNDKMAEEKPDFRKEDQENDNDRISEEKPECEDVKKTTTPEDVSEQTKPLNEKENRSTKYTGRPMVTVEQVMEALKIMTVVKQFSPEESKHVVQKIKLPSEEQLHDELKTKEEDSKKKESKCDERCRKSKSAEKKEVHSSEMVMEEAAEKEESKQAIEKIKVPYEEQSADDSKTMEEDSNKKESKSDKRYRKSKSPVPEKIKVHSAETVMEEATEKKESKDAIEKIKFPFKMQPDENTKAVEDSNKKQSDCERSRELNSPKKEVHSPKTVEKATEKEEPKNAIEKIRFFSEEPLKTLENPNKTEPKSQRFRKSKSPEKKNVTLHSAETVMEEATEKEESKNVTKKIKIPSEEQSDSLKTIEDSNKKQSESERECTRKSKSPEKKEGHSAETMDEATEKD